MNDVVLGGDAEDVVLLDGGSAVSMQLLQQIYREVTGKTERITKRFDVNHRTDFSDLENLNAKFSQLLEQYHIKERVCTVTFFHTDDCSERFSSFDRARAYEVGSTSPIENVRIEYSFLIVLPVAKKPQPYKIVVDVHSRAAIRDKVRDGTDLQRKLITAFDKSTGAVSIEYIDYAVARTMLVAINQWFDSLDSKSTSFLLSFSKKYSHNLPWLFKYATASVVAYGYWGILNSGGLAGASLGMYALLAFTSIFVSSGLAYQLGAYLEGVVDEMAVPSYLDLNKGDKKLIQRCSLEGNWALAKVAFSALGAIALNVFASWLAGKMGISG